MICMTVMYGIIVVALVGLPPADPDLPRQPREAPRRRSGWAQLVEGLAYIRSSPALLVLLGLAFAPLFFGMPFQTLMPFFTESVYGVGAAGLGAAMAAMGVGALTGALAAAAMSESTKQEALQIWLGVAFGISLIGFAMAPLFPLALLFLAFAGLTSAAYGSLNNSLVITYAEPRFHGRVMSVYMMSYAVMPFASVPASWLADHVGGPIVVAGGGLLVILSVVALGLIRPTRPRARQAPVG
jgi:Na+/melibiose symporter-like transporter